MNNDRERKGQICAGCGSSEAQAIVDAGALGLGQEFQAGIYGCCQIVEWANEQRHVWELAASEDRTSAECVPVLVRKRRSNAENLRDPRV